MAPGEDAPTGWFQDMDSIGTPDLPDDPHPWTAGQPPHAYPFFNRLPNGFALRVNRAENRARFR